MILLQTSTTTTIANPYILALIALIGPIAVVLISWLNTRITTNLQRDLSDKTVQFQRDLANTNLEEKRIEEKRKEISQKLYEFYAPLLQYLNKSSELNKIFKKDKPEGFRTLTYLLDPNHEYAGVGKIILTENDKIIFNEIIKVGKKIEDLIISKAGLVDDPRLAFKHTQVPTLTDITIRNNGLLALLSTHLLLIRHAYKGRLSGQVNIYKDYVFPQEINDVLRENINRLNKELNDLRSQ